MATPRFTDEELNRLVECGSTEMEKRLAQTVIDDRFTFRKLHGEITPMARQVICPIDNTFSRQLQVINKRL